MAHLAQISPCYAGKPLGQSAFRSGLFATAMKSRSVIGDRLEEAWPNAAASLGLRRMGGI